MEHEDLGDFGELENDVLGARALLWLLFVEREIHGAGVTQITGANGKRFCTIIAWAADGKRHWLPLIARVEEYARAQDCNVIRIFGRKGWARLLPDYSVEHVILEKEIS